VQRSAADLGEIPISGQYSGAPDVIEARAVVMPGTTNSGTSTAWQTIRSNPSGGTFTGVLTGVHAGGWYQVEVRASASGTVGTAAIRGEIGVGDIYVTAGQSNAGNEGSPPGSPSDDRVSTRTSFTTSTWRLAYDPQPLVSTNGGSPWSRLGGMLAAAEDVPIGFVCVAVGGSPSSQWLPGATTGYYNNRLKPVLQSLGVSGFRAVLWHQGEHDSFQSVTAATYAANLRSIINQSRADAGWNVPWHVAEVSYSPVSHLAEEEPVAAAHRMVVYEDPNTFLGPSTDEFHLEDANGGKMLADNVHFNAAGLAAHAQQWADLLLGNTAATLRNGDFEENHNPAITGLSPLDDGDFHLVEPLTSSDSPSVLGWRILAADHIHAADGFNGCFNPYQGEYAAADDTINGGVMPGMSGRQAAFFFGGSPGNYFLHTTRQTVKPERKYTLEAAIGVRDDANAFGGARIEILANGQTMASASFDKPALDVLRGGDSAGTFTEVRVSWQTGALVSPNQIIAVRIVKPGGAGTVMDFDNVRLTDTSATGFQQWQTLYFGNSAAPEAQPLEDSDHDGLINGIEYFLGSSPLLANPRPAVETAAHSGRDWSRYLVALDPAVTDTGLALEYSFDLEDWQPAATSPDGSVVATKSADSWTVDIARDTHSTAFFRLVFRGIIPAVP
jgi:hypothetical protein